MGDSIGSLAKFGQMKYNDSEMWKFLQLDYERQKELKSPLVHGGGPEISAMLKKIGKESKFINGMRYTDAETMDIVQMVLAGKVNKDLVKLLEQLGGRALGLCGLDNRMLMAEKKAAAEDLGFVGEITSVNTAVINDAVEKGYIPVISTIAGGRRSRIFRRSEEEFV